MERAFQRGGYRSHTCGQDHGNDWQTYHALLESRLRPGMRVLEAGCGSGEIAPFPWQQYREIELVGLDPDPAAARNGFLSKFLLLDDPARWPLDDASADLVISRYVLEHVADPTAFLENTYRVLRPGGVFLFLTPNWLHPAVGASHGLPLGLKRRLLSAARGTPARLVFRTFYRMNTLRKLRALGRRHDFRIERLFAREFEPYRDLGMVPLGQALSRAHCRIVTLTGLERWLGAQIIGIWRKA